jgi:hypothetical protein
MVQCPVATLMETNLRVSIGQIYTHVLVAQRSNIRVQLIGN